MKKNQKHNILVKCGSIECQTQHVILFIANLCVDLLFHLQMLSVQSPGYAGMERFGVDAGLGSPPNHRYVLITQF